MAGFVGCFTDKGIGHWAWGIGQIEQDLRKIISPIEFLACLPLPAPRFTFSALL